MSHKFGELYYECPDDLKRTMETISKSNEEVEDMIWITIFGIVRQMFFRTDKTTFSVENEDGSETCFCVNFKGMQNNNFFTVVKYVKDSMNGLQSPEEKNIMWKRNSKNIHINECPLQIYRSNMNGKNQFSIYYDTKVIKLSELQNFMKLMFQSASFFVESPNKKIKELNNYFTSIFI